MAIKPKTKAKPPRSYGRIVFWSLFLPAALITGIYFYEMWIPQRVNRYLRRLQHPNAKVASEAWLKLNDLYFTKWEAYNLILPHARDQAPINFLIEREPGPGADAKMIFTVHDRAIYYHTDQVYCRTVGDAILGFVYNEGKWRKDFEGDWDGWWTQNRGYYGILD